MVNAKQEPTGNCPPGAVSPHATNATEDNCQVSPADATPENNPPEHVEISDPAPKISSPRTEESNVPESSQQPAVAVAVAGTSTNPDAAAAHAQLKSPRTTKTLDADADSPMCVDFAARAPVDVDMALSIMSATTDESEDMSDCEMKPDTKREGLYCLSCVGTEKLGNCRFCKPVSSAGNTLGCDERKFLGLYAGVKNSFKQGSCVICSTVVQGPKGQAKRPVCDTCAVFVKVTV